MNRVPVIDLSKLPESPAALDQLDLACREWGFFQITGHGVARPIIDSLFTEMKAFFELPLETKNRVVRTAQNVWGFYDRELTKNTRDWKEIFDVGEAETEGPLAGSVPQWPEGRPEFRRVVLAFMEESRRVAYRLLGAISLNLGMPADHLAKSFSVQDTSFLRLNYYPVCNDPAPPASPIGATSGHFGINHHTDAGALTVLLQDVQPGLEVYREGVWHMVEPLADALVINIGDIVQVWSNDRYRAPMHRVIASSESPRYSAPFFFNPAYTADYAPLESVCDEEHPPRYRLINWGEFRAGRAAGDYADYGEEIQISQFRT